MATSPPRFLALNLRVRRNVAYVVASTAWAVALVAVGLWAVWQLAHLGIPIPTLRSSAPSVQAVDNPATAEERPGERLVLMLVAVGLIVALRAGWRRGQRAIDTRFYRQGADYRALVRGLGHTLTARASLDELAEEIVDGINRLLPLKRLGVIMARGERPWPSGLMTTVEVVVPPTARGFAAEEWKALASGVGTDAIQAAHKMPGEVAVEYAIPRLRRPLEAARINYLYAIRHDEAVVAVLFLGEKQAESPYTVDDFELIEAVAGQAGLAVENALLYERVAEQKRLQHELDLARRIQMASLPQTTPRVEGLDVAGRSIPATEVGGDFFDYLFDPPHRLGIVVGDVSGKGSSAAFYMSKVQGVLRSLHSFNLAPHELFVRANDVLLGDLEKHSFVTALGAFFDTATRRVVLTRAGHLPLYYFERATGEVRPVHSRGIGLGLARRGVFAAELFEAEVPYRAGDAFLLVTDGVTDCEDIHHEQFGEERIVRAFQVAASNGATASTIVDQLLTDLDTFSHERAAFDDQTLVVIRASHP